MNEDQSLKIADRGPGLKSFLDDRHQSGHPCEEARRMETEGDDC